jgi:hydroxymethylbilane synthase
MTVTRVLRVGTRRSALARAQTDLVVAGLGTPVEVIPIVTAGDRTAAPIEVIGGSGVFVSALREALLAGDIDLAVHSAKDLPVVPAEGIVIGAVPPREDPRDAVVARDRLTLAELPKGALVGTGSPRRAAQLRALGLDLYVVPVRGNVDTRLAHVGENLDAVVLAVAGLRRLGRFDAITEILDPTRFVPAPAQGALAVECRADDLAAREVLAAFDDTGARACITAERALLSSLEAGCSAPIGALAEIHDNPAELTLTAVVTAADGSDAVRRSLTGVVADSADVGRRLAAELIASGADKMMGSAS